jgi:hypothetical protein
MQNMENLEKFASHVQSDVNFTIHTGNFIQIFFFLYV